ncbi:tryptophan--tRNA ligase [Betaproteobacteria bacterium]|nr:tryptophan--tRNA ligase [Betaproteobacteria bacterium]GHU02576.1 tryptophan--tRNA ligase [Betaproteobacteria bacterium]GHU19986.1 tryptophan--tRNA ligase [Betaproteobacteria bacterium]
MAQQRILTGITPSGTPHLGNYAGAIRPAVEASSRAGVESFYFLSDYHALIKTSDPARVQRSTLEIAATWLAAGLDPGRVWFYRQSDIPEIPELTWLLTCVSGKGLLNRAHAYKAAVDKNSAEGEEPDAGVTMGLFMYPVLMAADILMFNAHKVPVGRDQIQHLEMARDIASSFNYRYGEHFVLPEAAIDDAVATLPGLDGRKMSKSYDNTIPLFASEAELKKLIYGIVTDSKVPGEPKETEGSALFQIYQAFASAEETTAMRARFAQGIAWGEAKEALFDKLETVLAPIRARYEALIADPEKIERILQEGAARLREKYATPFTRRLREAVGLRRLDQGLAAKTETQVKAQARPQFKQYRENDGLFYFKLTDGANRLLLQSRGFTSPRDAGQAVAAIKNGAAFEEWAALADGVNNADITRALEALRAE